MTLRDNTMKPRRLVARLKTPFEQWFGRSRVVDASGKPLIVYHGSNNAGFVAFDPERSEHEFFFTSNPRLAGTYGDLANLDPLYAHDIPVFKSLLDVRDFVKSPANDFPGGYRIRLFETLTWDEEPFYEAWADGATTLPTRYVWSLDWSLNGHTVEDISEHRGFRETVAAANAAVRNMGPRRSSGVYTAYLQMQKPLVVNAKGSPWYAVPFRRGLYKTRGLAEVARQEGRDGVIIRNVFDPGIGFASDEEGLGDVYIVFEPTQIKSAAMNNGQYDPQNPDIRRNGVPIHRQPSLFGGRDSAHLTDWRSATPHEIRIAAEDGHLTHLDLQEMRDLVAEVQADGTLAPMLAAGVSVALAFALVDGLVEDVEADVQADDVRRLAAFLEDGATIAEFQKLAQEFADRGFKVYHGVDVFAWVKGPRYRWTHAVIPTFDNDGAWVGESTYLIDTAFDVRSRDAVVNATLASKLADQIDMGSTDPEDYIDTADVDYANFWDFPYPLYHATYKVNVESIMVDGLSPRNESRGLRNRSVGASVFTTTELAQAFDGVYGDVVLEIDTVAMKRDGYTPRVHAEPDVLEAEAANSLMSALGEDDYHYDSENDPRTAIVSGSIPPQYLRIVEE